MEVINITLVEQIFNNLQQQYKVLAAPDENKNKRRFNFFANQCKLLNTVYNVPDDYCPFYWDQITCWNATPPHTTVKQLCVSWPMNDYPPKDQMVERRCLDGFWENMTSRTREMLYAPCNPYSDIDNNFNTFDMSSIVLIFRYISLIGYILSALILLLSLFGYIWLKKLKCGPYRIHFNLFLSFFIRYVLSIAEFIYATNYREELPQKNCYNSFNFDITFIPKIFTAIWNYSLICSYGWVFIEGLYLHNSIYFNVFKESKPKYYIICGWTIPLLIIIIWSFIKGYYDNTKYWIENCNENIQWILRAPLIIIVLAEVIITASIIKQLYTKVLNEVHLNEKARYRRFAKSFIYLLLSIGGSFFIFDIVLHSASFLENGKTYEMFIHLIYLVINSLWGIVMTHIYFWNNLELRADLKKRFSKPKGVCSLHAHSPTLLSSRDGMCPDCLLNTKLLELKNFSKAIINTECSTVVSTAVNSEYNTLQKPSQRTYPRVNYLSFCREETDENFENL